MQSYGCVYPQPLKSILIRKKQASVKAMLRAIGWGNKSPEDVSAKQRIPSFSNQCYSKIYAVLQIIEYLQIFINKIAVLLPFYMKEVCKKSHLTAQKGKKVQYWIFRPMRSISSYGFRT